MQVTLATLSQDFDLESGRVRNYIVLRLADGELLRADVSDASAEAIVRRFAESAAVSTNDAEPAPLIEERPRQDDLSDARAAKPAAATPIRVSSDELGYPMVVRPPARSEGPDEDGVPQL
ncbi:hypothetical protein LVJ94_35270 [Pendulispora rubella]|uniref:Uncharacterized protein n=1 Tax=Pendulispora rubella TaxID=2741070 RepID=A0ABZ2KTY5_9BACT